MVFENMIDSAQAGVLVPALISVSALLTGDTSELLTILSTAVTHKNTKHLTNIHVLEADVYNPQLPLKHHYQPGDKAMMPCTLFDWTH